MNLKDVHVEVDWEFLKNLDIEYFNAGSLR